MALRHEPLIPATRRRDGRVVAGVAALAAVALLIAGAVVGLGREGAGNFAAALSAFDAYLFRIARFTLWQALLSTALSVAPALLVARALSRHPRFFGRSFILRLFSLPLALPAIVAAMSVLALLGRAGYLAAPLSTLGGERWAGIYGLGGILVAHVFFNLPLATRLFLQALQAVPSDQWRLAGQLGMGAGASFRFIEWPALRAALPGVACLVFMLCVTSFAVVLTLGGGPRATTLEVAIYQSLRFDFDPARAVALTALQVAITVAVVFALARLGARLTGDASLPVAPRRYAHVGRVEAAANTTLIAMALLFVGAPLAAILMAGLRADLLRLMGEASVQHAVGTSLALAFCSATLAVVLAFGLTAGRRALEARRGRERNISRLERALDVGATFVLVVPPIVIGAGWFMLLRRVSDVFALAPVLVIAVNAVMAMPFAVRSIRPAYDASAERNERLCQALGISGWSRFRWIDWPPLKRPLATAFAFAAALSLGDLGVIALFGSDAVQTLPYLLLARMGSYRTEDAAGLALLLGALCLMLMTLSDRPEKDCL